MRLLPYAGNKLQLVHAKHLAHDTRHHLFAAKSQPSSAVYACALRVRLALSGAILLLGVSTSDFLHAAAANGMAPLPAVSPPASPPATQPSPAAARTPPNTSAAMEIGTTKRRDYDPSTRPSGKHLMNNVARTGANSHTAAIPAASAPSHPAQGEQQMPPARNTGPLRITRQQPELVEPLLQEAYLAYRDGKLEQAQRLYLAMFRKDMQNLDALLGLATIALQHGDSLSAVQYYMRVLALDPRNAMATAGMAALGADDGSNESRLKILLRDQGNAAILHFALGNLYARQMRWSEAQQAYFNAYTLESGNAAFAFNLAVTLDHLGQRDLAALHYQQAVQLDQANNAGLDHAHIAQRLTELLH